MAREVAGYLLEEHAFADGVSSIWHARSTADASRLATLRVFDIPEDGHFAGPMFAFRQDAQSATDLTHDHLVQTRNVGRRGRHTYVVSPHTPAVPLSAHLQGHALPADQALALLAPLAVALDAAAAADLAHGALHPRSIWVEPAPAEGGAARAVLSGFGLHHLLRVLAVRQREGGVMDDFLYVAPELLRGGRPTNRSDQYALAGALLHAMTGHPPYERDGLAALFGAHLFGRLAIIGEPVGGDDGGEAFAEIMARALAKNPDDRFDSCEQFVAEVERWRHQTDRAVVVDPSPEVGAQAVSAPAPEMAAPSPEAATAAVPSAQAVSAPAPEMAALSPEAATAAVPSASAPSPPAPSHEAAAAAVAAPRPRPLPTQSRPRRPVRMRATVFAAVGVIAGIVAVLVLVSRTPQPAGSEALAAATTAPASPISELPPGVRWRQNLPGPASQLYVTVAGVVAITPDQVVVVDPDTGGVLDNIATGQATTVTDDGGLVTSGAEGLQVLDIEDGSLQWRSEIIGLRPPAVAGGTLYGVSNDPLPQLIATDARSGQRLWQFPEGEPAFPADAAVAPGDDFVYLADSEAVYGILPPGASMGEDTATIKAGEQATEPLSVWRMEIDEDLWLSALQAVADGVIVAEGTGNVCMRGQADGELVWCLPVPGVADAEPTILTAGDQVLVVTPSAVTAIEAGTGRHLWLQTGQWTDAVLGDDGRLVAVEADGTVAVLSTSDGQMHELADLTVSSPSVLAVDGDVLYAAFEDGGLVSADLAELSGG